ncbi:helix-turn-helix domain-containing protein [Stygiolobus caldivivus]|uniref:Bacterio-opsin activator n=1 Tax=Stygiolobus caldivivus TaxID=2824673 RepID=A0A8D5UA82_9CREN|nr:helix-turn-helix domain-containing protein [Stygiolobus caldivivus]BCU71556.1 bacterio-opsin activator [Stygiolobus caldivivus]
MLKKVTVTVRHEDCWTSQVPFRAKTISLQVYPNKHYLRSRIMIDLNDPDVVKEMGKCKGVMKVNKVMPNRDKTLVDFLNVYKGSIAGILYDYEVLLLDNEIREGKEIWTFVVPRLSIREIVNEIKNVSKVGEVKIDDYTPSNVYLTDMERKVLLLALHSGYLDYPKKSKTEDLAKLLGISKVTFLYHLRTAEKKIISMYLDTGE